MSNLLSLIFIQENPKLGGAGNQVVKDGMGFPILQARRRVPISTSDSFTLDQGFAQEKLRKGTFGSYLSELATSGGTVPASLA